MMSFPGEDGCGAHQSGRRGGRPGTHGHRRSDPTVRRAQEGRALFLRALPVPHGEDGLVHRRSGEAGLLLLRVSGGRQCIPLPDGGGIAHIPGIGGAAGQTGRDHSSIRGSVPGGAKVRITTPGPLSGERARGRALSRFPDGSQGCGRGPPVPGCSWDLQRDCSRVRHRLRPGLSGLLAASSGSRPIAGDPCRGGAGA